MENYVIIINAKAKIVNFDNFLSKTQGKLQVTIDIKLEMRVSKAY